jgi:prepilin-type processing-associated H-X9-DG protein
MPRRAVTLVELLIVIAIITLLLQLAIPAVQMSREAARRTVCQNNLRQIGLSTLSHLSATGRFPSGGWGFSWAGDPDRGNDRHQPGGWVYNLLPYLAEEPLHGLGRGQVNDAKMESVTRVCQTPLPIMICPSRRLVRLYPFWRFFQLPMRNTLTLETCAKTDYAANAGDYFCHGFPGPKSLAEGDSPSYPWGAEPADDGEERGLGWYPAPKAACEPSKSTGPIYLRSEIRPGQVLDGMSNTYLAGEKYLDPEHYKDGTDGGDDQTLYGGFDADVNRFVVSNYGALSPPRRDQKRDERRYLFGSAHPDACNFVYCDGSVRAVSYSIDGQLHRATGNRQDGAAADGE